VAGDDKQTRRSKQSKRRLLYAYVLLGSVCCTSSSYKTLYDTLMPPRPVLLHLHRHHVYPQISPLVPVWFTQALSF
jgi:hypothetical protein